ncbi:MAG: Asp-tRNA(Asn)/Glu-tRNA(Gln) amidotransferase subunit GatB, partial [Spirochaetes bacterium]|nr:Asp-tRNA(Asn)/Glu-tRNA(Gln) amidotransferase subunit GatB [Spirochaetota bacterium]
MQFEPTIGLEVHVQLKTKQKIFCSCSTAFGATANTNVCPVCLGLPGTLPVVNEEAIIKTIIAGIALNCKIAQFSKFDRKNYFYPDLPKAYQISQYDKPLCENGFLEIEVGGAIKKIGIMRIHLEEDAGKLIHLENASNQVTYVDYNRTGIPLMEIVSAPDITSSDDAYAYLSELKLIMQYLNVSDCNMEEGSLRCDVNISIKERNSNLCGTKVEIKNLNSFKAVKAAIDYEIQRQERILSQGEFIVQETRLWNPENNTTIAMRSKEEAHDYRYFPDPDLPPIVLTDDFITSLRKQIPELPQQKRKRFINEYGISQK